MQPEKVALFAVVALAIIPLYLLLSPPAAHQRRGGEPVLRLPDERKEI